MKKKSLLITGGAGFIGSNFIPYLLQKYNNYHLVNLDALTYAGDLENLKEVDNNENYSFVKGDIRDKELLYLLFQKYEINGVIHFAAESHVDNSIKNPTVFAETNIIGTLNILEVARNQWMKQPFVYKDQYIGARFYHISTDEVYGSLGSTGFFTEQTSYAPNSPYSASKASSDMLVRSYFHTYGMNVVTSNCSNNFGPKQHNEKLIPKLIYNAINGRELPIYGDGKNIRDWLFVDDHCRAIDLIFHEGEAGETYLIGAHNERTTIEITEEICAYLDKVLPKSNSYKEQIQFINDRPGHDFRYAIDASKIEKELGWKAEISFDVAMVNTINWFIQKYKKMEVE
ncbi:dTDP-glucose 4,6-dehydratase [Bacillus timonensis]|uniref:dTDP-glucose 4,6-dehydratase n=1 Tax=Bacillus timonensis TaxID=1033734 RepID=UPI0002891339|nr:dTDP-glucose 4,6-dehydratase [Bacillus timonensis]